MDVPVTVMFGDLGGSTALVSRLDPGEMRKVIRFYQDTVAGLIRSRDSARVRHAEVEPRFRK